MEYSMYVNKEYCSAARGVTQANSCKDTACIILQSSASTTLWGADWLHTTGRQVLYRATIQTALVLSTIPSGEPSEYSKPPFQDPCSQPQIKIQSHARGSPRMKLLPPRIINYHKVRLLGLRTQRGKYRDIYGCYLSFSCSGGPRLGAYRTRYKVSQVHLDGLIVSDIAQYRSLGSSLAPSLSPCLTFWPNIHHCAADRMMCLGVGAV
ncbi:hypothetical protein PCH_Pc22g15740 [Penicillium rubens Wisconsin 54-1255]|uniref:Uncharacterized protein n=1 Tax=Penicillium rubens (strain ATCC 28089 / DSM 1075 / NRRL 1951 / Wisconsin 54-1255) TaxID=500485 RepID=B6HQB2_PENRW|nr:hypothetical protein PCH_Pc22g15740 [Penicillium rubens Wisconsin 54-1255]